MAQQDNPFTAVSIIYNPNSTGQSEKLATDFKQELEAALPSQKVELVATKHAGHAETLAYELAMATAKPLVISASGDGGYHEVVNGLVKAQWEGAKPVAGLLPAGNANDHFHNVHGSDIIEKIRTADSQKIDLLKITSVKSGKPFERYAHSYIGFGLTPKVGRELNRRKLNPFNEVWIVLHTLIFLHPVILDVGGKRRTYDSLVLSNVSRMSKVLNLHDGAELDDGKFEVTEFKRRNKLALIRVLLRASTVGLKGSRQVSTYSFSTLKPLLSQLDGEIYELDAKVGVEVTIEPAKLPCII